MLISLPVLAPLWSVLASVVRSCLRGKVDSQRFIDDDDDDGDEDNDHDDDGYAGSDDDGDADGDDDLCLSLVACALCL